MTTKRITRRVRATDKEDATLPLPLHFRVRPDTMKALKEAQAISGRTLSGECEAQLNRALVETNVALWPLMQLLSDILGKIPEFSKATRWADNYVLFDRAFNAITTMLEMLRPPGPIRQDATDDEKQQWRNLVLNSLFQIGQADASVPPKDQTREQRRLLKRKEDLEATGLGPVLARWAEAARKTTAQEFPTVPQAMDLWRLTRLLMAPPATMSGQSGMILNAEVMRKDPATGKLVPVSELEKKGAKK